MQAELINKQVREEAESQVLLAWPLNSNLIYRLNLAVIGTRAAGLYRPAEG